jgi:hypothetical protein
LELHNKAILFLYPQTAILLLLVEVKIIMALVQTGVQPGYILVRVAFGHNKALSWLDRGQLGMHIKAFRLLFLPMGILLLLGGIMIILTLAQHGF